MKILVLDDNIQLMRAVQRMLEPLEHLVDTAENAEVACMMVKDGCYDFVLVDYKMPVNDGIWFMENANIPKETKVLLMTGYVNRGVINKMFNLGAVGYLVKPFDSRDLLRHLDFHSKRQ